MHRLGSRTLLLTLMLLAPSVAGAAGAWQTYLRPTVFTALQAEGDTVWCATRDGGLLEFTPSSRSFRSFVRQPDGIAGNRLSSLAFDRSRRLWAGTIGNGASVLSPNRTRWSLVNAFDGLPSDSINTLAVSGDSVWIGTTRGLAVWDGSQISGVLPDGVNPSPFANDNITGIALLGDSVWVSTRAGVYVSRLSQGLTTWNTANVGLSSLLVGSMVTDGSIPFLVAATVAYRWDPSTGRWIVAAVPGSARTLSASRGAVFAAGGAGLYRWNGSGWTLLNGALASTIQSPMAATMDETGLVWAAGQPTTAGDVSKTGLYGQPAGGGAGPWSFDFPPGPPNNSCLNLDLEGPRVYVSTFGLGIGRFDGTAWKNWFPTRYVDPRPDRFARPSYPFAMLIDQLSNKWFTCWAPYSVSGTDCVPDTGIIEILDETGGADHVRHRFLGPAPDSALWSFGRGSTLDSNRTNAPHGRWFGLDSPCGDQPNLNPQGLLYFATDTSYGQSFKTGLSSSLVLSLTTDRNGRVWVGTDKGLCWFDDAGVAAAPTIHIVPSTELFVVRGLATHGDALWVSTSGGLYQYGIIARNNRGQYDIPAGPAQQAVRPIDVGTDGTVWLGTSNGVRAYHPGGTTEDFTSANSPLANDEVRSLRVNPVTGEVWIATAGGLNRFDPFYVASSGVTLPSLEISAYPNPGRLSAMGLAVKIDGTGTDYTGAVYDLNGRRVSVFSVHGNGRVVWNGRDNHDELVKPGIYFLRAESGGRSSVVRIVLLR